MGKPNQYLLLQVPQIKFGSTDSSIVMVKIDGQMKDR